MTKIYFFNILLFTSPYSDYIRSDFQNVMMSKMHQIPGITHNHVGCVTSFSFHISVLQYYSIYCICFYICCFHMYTIYCSYRCLIWRSLVCVVMEIDLSSLLFWSGSDWFANCSRAFIFHSSTFTFDMISLSHSIIFIMLFC